MSRGDGLRFTGPAFGVRRQSGSGDGAFPRRSAPTQSGVALHLPPHSTLGGISSIHRIIMKQRIAARSADWFALIRLNSLIGRRNAREAASRIAKCTAVFAGSGRVVPLCTGLYRIVPLYGAGA